MAAPLKYSCLLPTNRITATISIPKLLPRFILTRFSNLKAQRKTLAHQLSLVKDAFTNPKPLVLSSSSTKDSTRQEPTTPCPDHTSNTLETAQMYMVLEAIADRIEMHRNVGEQRDNWNALLSNSINMIILSASTMAGVSSFEDAGGASFLAFKLASTLLFLAAAGMLAITNKIQPSQLAEEQRNATRLFGQLYNQIETKLALHNNKASEVEVKKAVDKVLAIDRAYPLPLLGQMIDKFPSKFEPAIWWPNNRSHHKFMTTKSMVTNGLKNGWSEEMETEMREVIDVIKRRDGEEYMRLGNVALKVNKTLAILGPLLAGTAAIGSAFIGHGGSWAAVASATAGAMAAVVNTLEHGGQVGMLVEMYRNCAGYFVLLEETIGDMVEEKDLEKREEGELFEMNIGLQLGRSLSELRDLASNSSSCSSGETVDGYASKLF